MNLIEFLEEAGLDPYPYSGRGMYGKQCVAVTVTSFGRLFADVLLSVESTGANVEELSELFEGMRYDNMGHDYVFYFPRVPWSDDEDSDDVENDDDDSEEDFV
jgi:hypothetical protein